MPFGITLLAPGGHDALLASIGRSFHADTGLPLGALKQPQSPLPKLPKARARKPDDEIAIAVVGAHLSGMPLNAELKRSSGRIMLEAAATAPDYRLWPRWPDLQPAEARPGPRRSPARARRSIGRDSLGAAARSNSGASSPQSPRRCPDRHASAPPTDAAT